MDKKNNKTNAYACTVYNFNYLKEMFDLQLNLQTKLGNMPFKDSVHKQQFINLTALACADELLEALHETPWKNPEYINCGWKKTQEYNSEKFKEEIIDLWHFVINLTLASGMDSKELYNRFCNKNKENHNRQEKGY